MAAAPEATTMDTLYGGAISLRQPAKGYRVNVDALILAAFAAEGRRAEHAVDLGAGVGSVALAMHHVQAAMRFALIEREPALLTLAEENARVAGMPVTIWCCDVSGGLPAELRQSADLVVCNPPFFDPSNARQGPHAAKARARFGELGPFLEAAAAAVDGARSRAVFVYPARELAEFLARAEQASLIPKRLRFVHADAGCAARVALIELRKAKPGGLVVLPPLFEWLEQGVRTVELGQILSGQLKPARVKTSDRK